MSHEDVKQLVRARLEAEQFVVDSRHARGILSSSWSSGYIVALSQVLEDLAYMEENYGS